MGRGPIVGAVPPADPWALALRVLAGGHQDAVPELVARTAALHAAGARLFEVVVGTPAEAYGARLTFLTGDDPDAVVGQVGLAGHPWGAPDWIGLRTAADGSVRAKAYHRRPPLDAVLVHRGLLDTARPVMAAYSGGPSRPGRPDEPGRTVEVYAVVPGAMTWDRFAGDALAPLGCRPEPSGVTVVPRADGFALSVRHDGEQLTAITLFATSAGLRADAELEAEWVVGMDVEQADHHRQRMAAVASVSRSAGRRYRMLAWNYTRAGLTGRAVSVHAVSLSIHTGGPA